MAQVATIGFTQTTAERFFERLTSAGVRVLIDVRLHNTSQLSGFAKSEDLAFFLRKICRIEYRHMPILAPTDDILSRFKKEKGQWSDYELGFNALMQGRHIEDKLSPELLDGCCLLCSEAKPHHCHRRLVVDYLNKKWGGALSVRHL